MSKSDLYYVKDSPIHGKGLFAKKALKKGTVLGVCQTKKTRKTGLYTLSFDDYQLDVSCDLKYINHAKKPNAIYWDDLSVEVIKPIKKDQEIFHDYGEEWN